MGSRTQLITIMEERKKADMRKFYIVHLEVESSIISKDYDWMKVEVKGKLLRGTGCIVVDGVKYCLELLYSPFFPNRMDRIKITNHRIEYHDDIHVYNDSTLCLYHPIIDKPFLGIVPLHRMIPWITEWCHFYGEWKKYGVWLAPEVKHTNIR